MLAYGLSDADVASWPGCTWCGCQYSWTTR